MEGTDIRFPDSDYTHDHTYYGNGCPGDDNQPESYKSCSTRIVNTFDEEPQLIGVYYDFQAATAGAGGAITTDNANAPDTFCPLGWQLPYSGTGGDYYDKPKSNDFLFNTYGIADSQSGANQFRSYPFSYVFSGRLRFEVSGLKFLDTAGFLWSITIGGPGQAFRTEIWYEKVRYASAYSMTFGYALRCDFDISNLESFPWHPRSLISIMAFHFLKAHFPSVKIMSNYLKK